MLTDPARPPPAPGPAPDLATILREWGRIGCIGFGGPPTHIKLLRDLCVDRTQWLAAGEFEDALATCNLLPGPASTQLAIFCAWRLRGRPGALIGGTAFILPGLVVILGLAALFLSGSPPAWVKGAGAGAGAAVAAVAVQAGASLIPPSLRRAAHSSQARWAGYLAAGAAAAATIGPWLVLVLIGCGGAELIVRRAQRGHDRSAGLGPGGNPHSPAGRGPAGDPPAGHSAAHGPRAAESAGVGLASDRLPGAFAAHNPGAVEPAGDGDSAGGSPDDEESAGGDAAGGRLAGIAAAPIMAPIMAAGAIGGGISLSLAWVAIKVGALSYGGGFVIIPLMQSDAVSRYHWMTGGQFLNAVALGQVTPGPVVQTVAAVGYAAAGVAGGLLASAVAFAPSFAFVLLGARHFGRLRGDRRAAAFLAGAGPAAIGAILGSAIPLTRALTEPWQYAVLAGAAVLLLVLRRGVVLTLLAAAAVGVLIALAGSPLPA
jgi:chromate transporter